MNEKRMEIMESAIKFFSKKGYFSTSVQEIAEDCGISKGSLYKYFDSKEDLLVELFEYNHNKMLQKANYINLDTSLSAQQRLKKLIIVELEGMMDNKDFFSVLSKSLPVDKNKKLLPLMKRTRGLMINWHKDSIKQTYGDKVEDYLWDLTIMFQGAIKEYVYLIAQEKKRLEVEKVADMILNCLNAIVYHSSELKPVLTSNIMKEYGVFEADLETKSKEEQLVESFTEIKRKVSGLVIEEEERKKLLSSCNLLEEEINKGEPRNFLIDALLAYLDRKEELTSDVEHIKPLLYP